MKVPLSANLEIDPANVVGAMVSQSSIFGNPWFIASGLICIAVFGIVVGFLFVMRND